nr:unnamed protein product [Digitaria exilis]
MAAASSPAVVIGTAVFQPGPHRVDTKHVDQSQVPSVPKPVMVVTPTDAGTYPVAVFLHGCNLVNSWYESLLTHVASHGFIALYGVALNLNDLKDIDATRLVAAWLADKDQGLAHVLADVLGLHGVKPDLSRLALAGHSRGGDTAFATALGLGVATALGLGGRANGTTPPPLSKSFSALIAVDPVAGLSKEMQVEPKVLTFKPRSLDPGMPVLVFGTGKGPKHIGGPPCAPAGVNHVEFYDECATTPRCHVVLKDYGHMDMLDDGVPYVINNCMCMRNLEGTKDAARRAIGGVVVAFLRATLEGDDRDLNTVLDNPGLAPAVLDPVEHDLAATDR